MSAEWMKSLDQQPKGKQKQNLHNPFWTVSRWSVDLQQFLETN